MENLGIWIAVGVGVVVILALTVGSKGHKSKSKMDLNRRSGSSKILDDYDAEQNFVDKYSK